jgi:hypothetical protein
MDKYTSELRADELGIHSFKLNNAVQLSYFFQLSKAIYVLLIYDTSILGGAVAFLFDTLYIVKHFIWKSTKRPLSGVAAKSYMRSKLDFLLGLAAPLNIEAS